MWLNQCQTFNFVKKNLQLEEDDDDDQLPDDQEAAQFGWFNDLYILDTGTYFFLTKNVHAHLSNNNSNLCLEIHILKRLEQSVFFYFSHKFLVKSNADEHMSANSPSCSWDVCP